MITFVIVFFAVCQPNFMSQLFRKALCLPSATVVAERLCFHRCLSVHGGRCTPPGRHPPPTLGRHPLGRHPRQTHLPRRHTSPADIPSADTPPGRHNPLGRHPQADTPLGRHLPGRHTPASDIWWPSLEPPADPPRWILQRTVGILLECNLV